MWERHNSVAQVAMSSGNMSEAESQFKMALMEAEKLGKFDQAVATVCNNLGNCLRAQSRYAEAENFFKRAIEVKEKTVGPNHSDLVIILENYAKLLRVAGRDGEADKMSRRAHTIFSKK